MWPGDLGVSTHVAFLKQAVTPALSIFRINNEESPQSRGGRLLITFGWLWLVDHDIGRVPAGELRLIVGTAALLVSNAIGHYGRAIRRKRMNHGSNHHGSRCCRCGNRDGRANAAMATGGLRQNRDQVAGKLRA